MIRRYLVVGLGVTGTAVARALVRRGEPVVAVDDRPSEGVRQVVGELDIDLVAAPPVDALAKLVGDAAAVLPAPGLPPHHPVFGLARDAAVPVLSEFDLAARWDDRPLLAVTGTDGKTTVTTLVAAMLKASGVTAGVGGNTEVPLVSAIDDPAVDVFVVEASSFRLAHSQRFAPAVGTWLNFAPDHLDNHATLVDYELAKARIWRDQGADGVAVGNADDPVVAKHLVSVPAARPVSFGLDQVADYRVQDGHLVAYDDEVLAAVDEVPRAYPHDLLNALAAAATARPGGATPAGVRSALLGFEGLPHRMTLVGELDGVRFVDDSKATTPHAVVAAVAGLAESSTPPGAGEQKGVRRGSVVLICGGRNKGLELTSLASVASRLRGVVAIGEAADEVVEVFGTGVSPVQRATTMDQAVTLAARMARSGDTVLLSPGCASFDWYGSYAERGDDFARAVRETVGATFTGGSR